MGRTRAVGLLGLEARLVDVEAQRADGVPNLRIVGMADTALSEARERVRAALASCGIGLPNRRLLVNLSPAALPKTGAGFDLAIAVALVASGGVPGTGQARRAVHLGELGLDGRVHPVRGVLPMVAAAVAAGARNVVVSAANAREAALVPGAQVMAIEHLSQLLADYGALDAPVTSWEPLPEAPASHTPAPHLDLADVVGQPVARRALEVAAVGRHHLSMIGPPGAGKTLLARRLPTILPDLTDAEAVEVTALHSVAGILDPHQGLIRRPPLQAPHHTASRAAIVGGGPGIPLPGAISTAHHGVLFLDEAAEFPAAVLQTLRQPLEEGHITLHRAKAAARYPAQFQLVLASNPCPCGGVHCTCSPGEIRRYRAKLSGPLMDRVDIRLTVPRPTQAMRALDERVDDSATVAQRVRAARERAVFRYRDLPWEVNGQAPGTWLRSELPRDVRAVLDRALQRGMLTMRGVDRALRVAWSLADLAGAARLDVALVGEALGLREGAHDEL